MSELSSSAGDERKPPLAQDLVSYSWKFGEGGDPAVAGGEPVEEPSELDILRGQVQQFTSALEDIVTLALSNADYKERAIMMHRRAVAALSGMPARRPGEATQR